MQIRWGHSWRRSGKNDIFLNVKSKYVLIFFSSNQNFYSPGWNMMFYWGGWGWTSHRFVGIIFLSLFYFVIGMIYSGLFLVSIISGSGSWNWRRSCRRGPTTCTSFIIGLFTRGCHGLLLASSSFRINHLTHWEKTIWRYLVHNLISWKIFKIFLREIKTRQITSLLTNTWMMVRMLHCWIWLKRKIWRTASSSEARGCYRI